MEITARMTSKGQVTIPSAVRRALALETGDSVVFRVEGGRAVLARTPDLLELAGSIEVPVARRGAAWADVLRETRSARSARSNQDLGRPASRRVDR
jgi:AbrB family looped-hinge helix DNA binding protein